MSGIASISPFGRFRTSHAEPSYSSPMPPIFFVGACTGPSMSRKLHPLSRPVSLSARALRWASTKNVHTAGDRIARCSPSFPSTAATRVFLPCPARSATNSAREPHAIGQTAPRRGSLGPPLADGAGADRPRASGPVPRVDPPGDRHECSHQSGSLPGRRDSPDADLEGAALRRLAWKSQARGGHARFDRLRPYGQMLRTQSRLAQRRHRRRRPGAESSPIAHPLACQLRLFL